VREDLDVGTVMVVEDHLNLTGRSPLVGPTFVDMVDAYSPKLRTLALATPGASGAAVSAKPGIYAQVPGPQFESPAEVRMLRQMGADVVGMSMALETIAARRDGAEVLGLAVVTNGAASSDAGALPELASISAVGSAAVPTVAGIIRHVIGSLS